MRMLPSVSGPPPFCIAPRRASLQPDKDGGEGKSGDAMRGTANVRAFIHSVMIESRSGSPRKSRK